MTNDDRARRLYWRSLALAPDRLRRHAPEMAALFAERLDAARRRGRWAVAGVWVHALWDLAVTARRTRRRHPAVVPIARRGSLMSIVELRQAARALARQRFSTSLAIAMLALGIAASLVVFSLIDGLYLRPLPFPSPERLVSVNEQAPRWNLDRTGVNYPDFDVWQRTNRTFESMALYDSASFNLAGAAGSAEHVLGGTVTSDFARVLGVTPLIGRMFTAAEDVPHGPHVVVLSEGLWRERFGGSLAALGQALRLDGVAYTIVGVLPGIAEFPLDVRLWVPLGGDPAQTFHNYSYAGLGRLAPGATVAQAEADLLRAQAPIWAASDKEKVVSPFVRPLRADLTSDLRATTMTLWTAVVLLLGVACLNVAALMLARAIGRRREMGIRLAIGASRLRLGRQLLIENLLIAIAGGAIGTLAGRFALGWLTAALGDRLPTWVALSFDGRTLACVAGLVAGTALVFGSAPALHAVRGDLRGALNEAATATTMAPRGRRTLAGLVGVEFALAAMLLVSGGLLLRAFGAVERVDPGFRPDHVLTFALALPDASYATATAETGFFDRLLAGLRATPGVERAGLVNCAPLGCHWGQFYRAEGAPPPVPGAADPVVLLRVASPGYLATMGIRLLSGRDFDAHDTADTPGVAIVNDIFARQFWPGVSNPIGRRFRGTGKTDPWITVVGLVADERHYGLEEPMRPGVFLPVAQDALSAAVVAVRTTGDPAAFTPTARAVLQRIDPDLALYRVQTMETALAASLRDRATYSALVGIFAGLALVLALGGAYGVTSYLVTKRRREIGIRIAIGAGGAAIFRDVLRHSAWAVGIGTVVGLAAAVGAARVMASLLFGISPADPVVLAGAAAALGGAALLANWIPARRAMAIDPLAALRQE